MDKRGKAKGFLVGLAVGTIPLVGFLFATGHPEAAMEFLAMVAPVAGIALWLWLRP